MNFEPWFYWLLAAIVFFIIEIFTPAFVMACFGIGCIFGTVGALFGASINLQFILFSIGSLISFFTVRPLMMKYALYKKASKNEEGGFNLFLFPVRDLYKITPKGIVLNTINYQIKEGVTILCERINGQG